MSTRRNRVGEILCWVSQVMSPPIEVIAGGIRWWVMPECRQHLLGPGGLRLTEWLQAGQARIVKQGPHRIVYRIDLPELRCHLKHNRISDLRSWLRGLIRPSKARTEYRRALKVAARGVPTIVPLALGEECSPTRPRDSFLITRTLDGALMFHTFVQTHLAHLPPSSQARLRQQLALCLGEFLACIHHAGVLHRDLHCGNILVQQTAAGALHLYLVDLQAVRLGPPLDWARSQQNLIVLNRWPFLYASRSDRLRFWLAYCRTRRQLLGDTASPGFPLQVLTRDQARLLEQKTQRSNQPFWRSRDRRCLGNNRRFQRFCQGSLVGHALAELAPADLAELLADPDRPFRQAGARLLKDSYRSTVVELELSIGGRKCPVIYKRFSAGRWRDRWLGWLRWFYRPPALRSWLAGHGLQERGLPTPRPLAVFHRRRWGFWCEGYLLTEKISEALNLHQVRQRLARLDAATRRPLLRALIDELARLVRTLHQRQLSHRDLKAANILVQLPTVAGQPPRCWLIDLVGVSRRRWLTHRRCLKDLARLHASFYQDSLLSRTDKLRFLRTYLQWGLRGRQGWKKWWRALAQATQAKVQSYLRRGRPLG